MIFVYFYKSDLVLCYHLSQKLKQMYSNKIIEVSLGCYRINVSRRDKMRRFAQISHIELLVSVERCGNVVCCSEKSFNVS